VKVNQRLLISLILQTGFSFVISALFVILFFRLFPNKIFILFPAALVLGMVFGLLFYLPMKSFLEKQ
jgi:hypothetical protein